MGIHRSRDKKIRTILKKRITTCGLKSQLLDLYIHYPSQALLQIPIFVIAGAVAGPRSLNNLSEYKIDWSVVRSKCNSLGGARETRQLLGGVFDNQALQLPFGLGLFDLLKNLDLI